MLTRRKFSGLAVASFAAAGGSAAARSSASPRPVLITLTFVQALTDRRVQLATFLERNWLELDRRGIAAGIFSHATLYEIAGAGAAADPLSSDFVVEVGYLTAGGYQDVEARFRALRAQHETVLVDGLDFKQLGRVVGDRQLLVRAAV